MDVATDGQIVRLIEEKQQGKREGAEADGMLSTLRKADDQNVR